MVYFCSDLHLCHDKDFLYGKRGFNNQYDMNAAIIKNWNNIVAEEDDVYVLGDLMLCDNIEGIKCLKQLRGRIHVIRGNHDTDARMKLYDSCYNVVEICDAKWLQVEKQMFFLSHYPCLTSNFDEQRPLNHRIINLCGHTHTNDKWSDFNKGLIYHVDMDAHACAPVSAEQVIEDIKNKLAQR